MPKLKGWKSYSYLCNNAVPEAKLVADDGAEKDSFGTSVAISKDHIVVGANATTDNDINPGSAYVFKRTGASWLQEAKLTADDGAPRDSFGVSVAIAEDIIVVGASGIGNRLGSIYTFTRGGAGWIQEARIKEITNFGYSVATSGNKLIVGAPGLVGYSGFAYLYKRGNGAWIQESKLIAGNNEFYEGDYFGIAVAVSENSAVIGASWDVTDDTRAGTAYILE